MSPLYIGLSVFFIVLSLALVTMILLQNKESKLSGGMAGMSGGDSSTYWNKNKGRSFEGTMEKYSKIAGAAFMVLSVVLCLII